MGSLTRDEFWSIIDRSNKDRNALRPLLEPLGRVDLIMFHRFFMEYGSDLRDELPEREESDYQEELAWYVVAQGKAFYDDVYEHPEKFPEEQGPAGRGFRGMIAKVYRDRFGEEVMEGDNRQLRRDQAEREFWAIIDGAARDRKKLRAALEPLSRRELLEFYREFIDLARELREPESDYEEELSWYVVAHGKAAYDAVLAHPETFPEVQGPEGRGFMGMISTAFFEKFGEEIDDDDDIEP